MSKYATGKFGILKYGEQGTQVYYESNISAKSLDYKTILLTWKTVTPDPADSAPTHWKVVKSYTGAVDSPENAIFVDGDVFTTFRLQYQDTLFTEEDLGKEIIYSFWVFNVTLGWIFCGKSSSQVIGDTGTLNKVTKWIPRAWLNTKNTVGDVTGEPESNNQLVQVLSAYTFMYDVLRTKANILEHTSNPKDAHTSLLRHFVNQFGFEYEPSLGDTYHSTLYKAGNVINSLKGTTKGVQSYVTALTHLESEVAIGHNLLLDYNDASFEESVGRWTVTSGTLTNKVYGGGVTAPIPYNYDSSFPLRAVGYGSLTTASTTAVTMRLPGTADDKVSYGIPVKEGVRYLFSGWVKQLGANAASVNATIDWYNNIGGYISSNTVSSTYTTTTSWQECTSKSDLGRNGQLAPSNAAYAAIKLVLTPSSASSNEYIFDMLQFAAADLSLDYEDARLITVYLNGDENNYTLNPSFEAGTGYWLSYGGTLIQDSLVSSTAVVHQAYVGKLTTTSSGLAGISSIWTAIDPGDNYVFSANVLGPIGRTARIRAEYSHHPSTTTDMQTTITNVLGSGSAITYTGYNTFTVGETVNIVDVDPVAYNLAGVITNRTANDFTIAGTVTSSYVSGGTASMRLLDVNSTLSDVNGEYYSNVVYYVESEPVTLDGTSQRLTIIGTTPKYEKDAGNPLVKMSVHIDDNISGDVYYFDAMSIQDGSSEKPFFDGVSGIQPTDPLTEKFFAPNDCEWEKKNRTNFVSNPSFETTSNWTATGATLTVESPAVYGPLFGTYSGKVAYTSTGSLSATVYLPVAAVGGEDVCVSAYVRAANTVYTIGTNTGGSVPTTTTYPVIPNASKDQWVRIHNTRILQAGETSFTFNLSVANPGGSTSTYFHIDGAQAEYGEVPTRFIDPALSPLTTIIPNPLHTATNIYTTQEQNINGGKSSYISNYTVKYTRLIDTLDLIMPMGSTWRLRPGFPAHAYEDLTSSLIPSASFEKDLGTWAGSNSTLTRYISRGTLSSEYVTHGMAYCKVLTSRTSGSPSFYFGITTDKVYIQSGNGYYCSAAIRPENSYSTGTYVLTATIYDSNDAIVQYTPTGGSPTNSVFTHTVTNTSLTRWGYMSIIAPSNTTVGGDYAIVKVEFQPDTFNATQAFGIDRVVFRE